MGRYYPDAYADAEYGIKFTNCHVAAQIDVNNDVCGNYQYYWYRYCGMVIGTVEKSTAEGGADLTGIVAENCTVNFGDRHEYYYCEFVKNSIASYTHDYQFSRVDNADITITNGVPSCNHDHAARGTEVIDGETVLVEDKQAVYLPFRQLFGGNGWGIKGVDEYDNIDISTISKSIVKFETVENAPVRYLNAETNQEKATVKVGQLFKSADNKEYPIVANNVQVFVSPADKDSTVSAVYNAAADWTQGTLTFDGCGDAIVSITEYQYCLPTILRVSVNDYYYTITYVKDGVVEKVQPVKNNSVPYSDWYEIPNESRVYQWVNAASVAAQPIPAGNQKDITLYVDWADTYTARFLYQDGSLYKEIDFNNLTGKLNEQEPGVPAVSGLISNGWEPYTLKGAEGDVTIKPIYKCNEFVQLEPVDDDDDGITNFYRVVGSTIVGENVDIIIPDYIDSNGATIEQIATGAFQNGDLRDVHVPNSVKWIGKNAFTKDNWREYPQIQIIYDGTQAEWDALEKATGWDDNIGTGSTIICLREPAAGYYKQTGSNGFLGGGVRVEWTWQPGSYPGWFAERYPDLVPTN